MSGLTKDELRSALLDAGVSPAPPTSLKKEELLQLYRQHVNPSMQYSDDEDTEVELKPSTSSRSPRKSNTSANASATVLEDPEDSVQDVETLTDDQLFNQLKDAGIEVGPIVASTRKFYERKLAGVLVNTSSGSNGKEFSDTEGEQEDEEDDQPSAVVSPIPEKRVTRSSTKSPSEAMNSGLRQRLVLGQATGEPIEFKDETDSSLSNSYGSPRRSIHSYKVTEVKRQTVTRGSDGVEHTDTFHTIERQESDGSGDTKQSQVSKKTGGSWMSRFVKLLLLLLVCLGLYLVVTGGGPLQDSDPAQQVLDAIQEAVDEAGGASQGPQPAVQRDEAPIQGNLADI